MKGFAHKQLIIPKESKLPWQLHAQQSYCAAGGSWKSPQSSVKDFKHVTF